MKRRALLVHPWICDFAAYDFWIHPLGLLLIGGFLRGRGWEVELVDALAGGREETRRRWDGTSPFHSLPLPYPACISPASASSDACTSPSGALAPPHPSRRFRRYGRSSPEIAHRLGSARRPDAILVSIQMTYWYRAWNEVLPFLQAAHPGVPIFLGGGYACLEPAHASRREGAAAVFSERRPDRLLASLCRHLAEPPPRPEELERLSAAWSLCESPPHAALLTSWGCPFACAYCATPGNFGGWRPRAMDAVVTELEEIRAHSRLEHIACYDDALLYRSADHFLPFVKRVAGNPRLAGLRWHFPNALHARWLGRPVAAALRRLGAESVWIGAESCDAEFLRATGDKARVADVEAALAAMEAERFRPRVLGAYVLAGVPGLADESVVASMERLHSLGLAISLATYSPIPGTPLFAQAAAKDPRLRTEPLLQNNTLREMADPMRWARLRGRARELNRILSRGAEATPQPPG